MVAPLPGDAPVIPPVMAPIVQLKLLALLAARAIVTLLPLQIEVVRELVITGFGLTVTVIGNTPHETPVLDFGVTIYCTVPEAELLGLESV
jgi:hypothetical protein